MANGRCSQLQFVNYNKSEELLNQNWAWPNELQYGLNNSPQVNELQYGLNNSPHLQIAKSMRGNNISEEEQ